MVNRRRWRGFLPLPGVLLLAAGTAFAAPAWEEPGSPFRAEFEVLSQPDLPEAGVAVQVPACGLAAADGSDVRATDGRGRVLPVLPLGAGTDNSALVLVKPPADCPRVFCYFGSGVPAKKSPLDFKPGLTLDVRTMPAGRPPENRRELEKLLERSERIARLPVTEISQAGNPADLRGGYFLVFEGFLNVPKELAGTQTFMLVAAEAGWLQVRERVVAEIAGRRRPADSARGEFRGDAELPPGLSTVRCVAADFGRGGMAVVARWKGPKEKAALAPRDFLKSGASRLLGTACRDAGAVCPAFRCRALSYIGYQDVQYTEVQFETCGGGSVEWLFSDGARLSGAKVSRGFVGLDTRGVTAAAGRAEAHGTVTFPQARPPPPANIFATADFLRYSALIAHEPLDGLDIAALQAFRAFLACRERNPDLIPVCQSLIRRSSAPTARFNYSPFLELARSAAADKPETAAQAYGRLLVADNREPWWAGVAEEYAEFALFRQRDAKLAIRIADALEARGGAGFRGSAATIRYLAARQDGDAARARECLAAAVKAVSARPDYNPIAAVIRRNEMETRFEDLLKAGFLQKAWETLREWREIWPDDWDSGRLPLARAKLWRAFGWPAGAVAELDGAAKLNPLLPNLPELEFVRAQSRLDLGENAAAKETLRGILAQYPNHPAAAAARTLLERLR